MPRKDPEERRLYFNEWQRRRRSDPVIKAHEAELRRARYKFVKDRLNAKRRKPPVEKPPRQATPPVPPKKRLTMVDKVPIVRDALRLCIPNDGAVHKLKDIMRIVRSNRVIILEAIIGTDIKTVHSGKTTFLYRLPPARH
jgi:hypothetical protein